MKEFNNNHSESLRFIALLKHKKIEEAVRIYMNSELVVEYNQKERIVKKGNWLKYLKNNLLKPSVNVVQFNISEVESLHDKLSFKIHLICKNFKGNLFFTELTISNKWNDKNIYKTTYKLTSY